MAPPLLNPSLTPPQQTDGLQLQDIHLPNAPSVWPLAIGWWVLLALIIMVLIGVIVWIRKKQAHQKQQQQIFSTLKALERSLKKEANNQSIADINIFLRQLMLMRFSASEVASLTGEQWLAMLDKAGDTQAFSHGVGRILIEAPYQAKETINLKTNEFIRLIRTFTRHILKNTPRQQKSTKSGGGV